MRCLALVVLLTSTHASAGDADEQALVVLGGVNLGQARHDETTGFLLGGELSVAFTHVISDHRWSKADAAPIPFGELDPIFWGGLYADVTRDFAADFTRMSIGPELGFTMLGVDGGLLAQLGDDNRFGWTVRPVLTIGVISLYWRHGQFRDEMPNASFNEIGVLLKWGRPVWERKE